MRIAAALLLLPVAAFAAVATPHVQVTVNEGGRRVDITVGGKPFTSYIWPTTLKKPVLYPLRTANGTVVTRGFPLEPRPGERVDHPHHVGLWFNYGDVNGLDFWNNSDAIRRPTGAEDGHDRASPHRRGEERRGQGELDVERSGCGPTSKPLLREDTRFIFRGDARRAHDRSHHDAHRARSSGRLQRQQGRRARHARRAAARAAVADKPEEFTDAQRQGDRRARSSTTPACTGHYISQRGQEGRRRVGHARQVDDAARRRERRTPVTHRDPRQPVEPRLSRPTGMRAATGCSPPIRSARRISPTAKSSLNLTLEPGKSVTFKYRMLILSGAATPDAIEREQTGVRARRARKRSAHVRRTCRELEDKARAARARRAGRAESRACCSPRITTSRG